MRPSGKKPAQNAKAPKTSRSVLQLLSPEPGWLMLQYLGGELQCGELQMRPSGKKLAQNVKELRTSRSVLQPASQELDLLMLTCPAYVSVLSLPGVWRSPVHSMDAGL
jgi:hypothetical protein